MPNLNPYNIFGSGRIFTTIYYDFGWDFCRVIWILSLNKTDSPRSQTPGRFTRRRFRRRGGLLTGAGYQTAGSHVLADFFFLPEAKEENYSMSHSHLPSRLGMMVMLYSMFVQSGMVIGSHLALCACFPPRSPVWGSARGRSGPTTMGPTPEIIIT